MKRAILIAVGRFAGVGRGERRCAGQGRYRLAVDLHGPGTVHDIAGTGIVLRRSGRPPQRVIGIDAVFRNRRDRDRAVDRGSVQPGLQRRRFNEQVGGGLLQRLPFGSHRGLAQWNGARNDLYCFPVDFRHHHLRPDCGWFRRTHAVCAHAPVLGALVADRLRPGVSLGSGRRLAVGNGLSGFCRRRRGPSDRGRGRAGDGAGAGAPFRVSAKAHASTQSAVDGGRRRHASGWDGSASTEAVLWRPMAPQQWPCWLLTWVRRPGPWAGGDGWNGFGSASPACSAW